MNDNRLHLPSPSSGAAFRLQTLGGSGPNSGEVNWLWRGYLAPGQLTLLTAPWLLAAPWLFKKRRR